jgi:hypothetical protein
MVLFCVLFFGLLHGLLFGLFIGLGIGLFCGLFLGLQIGLLRGGLTILQHLLLRLILVWNNFAPWRYADFLDYAAERIFLCRVGGGYMFIHRYLLEYFASLNANSKSEMDRKV